ncbi:MAG: amidase family protein [Verrucomicrobiota bacterium]
MSELPNLELASLRAAYQSGRWTPTNLVKALDEAISAAEPSHIWIHRLSRRRLLAHAKRVESRGIDEQPLFGVPFAIKDNIDLAKIPTTAAENSFFASRFPKNSSWLDLGTPKRNFVGKGAPTPGFLA